MDYIYDTYIIIASTNDGYIFFWNLNKTGMTSKVKFDDYLFNECNILFLKLKFFNNTFIL